jgi:hypothetical protein
MSVQHPVACVINDVHDEHLAIKDIYKECCINGIYSNLNEKILKD